MTEHTQEAADGLRGEPVRRLTVLFDERCPRCRRLARWLTEQRFRVTVELLPAGSQQARDRYPHVAPWLGRELVVVDNNARAWIGSPAFVMCLWAMDRYRWASALATTRIGAPAANAFFRRLSTGGGTHRPGRDSDWLRCDDPDGCDHEAVR